ncbi:RlpA-like protein precursor [Mannheimia haemolytica]|uniref:Endolytic peptidoglycan transglycosylase RlpA n=1 Tax=Mannheimia haemolytica TaxID=75985 RepID=A0A3S4XV06_MANHA|nr:septal ring lytic transglycosylase RlpA family protein [Mannheimia haemolytica]VEI75388.1 RlpA-like protein precursor [Mannheimia haemolytica]
MRLGKIVTLLLAGFLTFSSLNSLAATKNTKAKSSISTKKQATSKAIKKVGTSKVKKKEVVAKATKKKTISTVTTKAIKSKKKLARKVVKKTVIAKKKLVKGQHKLLVKKHFQTGVASYYANQFNGRRTANGETFNNAKMTAAHRTLPFGTLIEVTNLRNGRSVVVRVNDRGPYAHARVLDLSSAAAKKIGMHHSGTARVKIAIVDKSKLGSTNQLYVMN